MKFLGYYVNGKNYGCTAAAKVAAEKAAVEQGKPITRHIYKV